MLIISKIFFYPAIVFSLLVAVAGHAAELDDDDESQSGQQNLSVAGTDVADIDKLARELSHPVTSLRSYGIEVTYSTFSGSLPKADDQRETILRFRPTYPIQLSNGKRIIIRADIWQHQAESEWRVDFDSRIWKLDDDYNQVLLRQSPQVTPDTGYFRTSHAHVADIDFDVAYGGVSDNGFISMYGIAGTFPTSQNISTDRKQMLLGPEVAFGKMADWGVAGFWLKQLVDLGGNERISTNETNIQVFFAYTLDNGWQLVSNPTIIYDWEADSGNELLLPLGGGIAKTAFIGDSPWKFALELQNYLVTPDRFGPEWMLSFNITPAFGNGLRR